jgi:hypothetical protein
MQEITPEMRGSDALPFLSPAQQINLRSWAEEFGIQLREFHMGHVKTYEDRRLPSSLSRGGQLRGLKLIGFARIGWSRRGDQETLSAIARTGRTFSGRTSISSRASAEVHRESRRETPRTRSAKLSNGESFAQGKLGEVVPLSGIRQGPGCMRG